ncbi:arrestin domain-containing protein 17-like [Sitodiplosis mosellana]|uniref:arrestin domain-containing protein 17-like n=1 Tax=Sitodiplosis mosellana TaxID=263140 RepID=UPI00244407BA|nr:arrestin domain-containing protein 17-like [Sitodiplosis mosellana]XP_055312596.1 arrestin domain-containing protein 17-like [Sitodiplosis mosellana]
MPITCQINFENNPQKIVYSGRKLHITVRLKLTEVLKVRCIYIRLRGMAHVRFVVDDCMCVSSYGKSGHYEADESVLDMRKCLVGRNGKNQVLPVGTHDFSFAYTLPSDLPSTFSSDHGDISYTANVVVHKPIWLKLKSEKICEEKFTVFKTLNLNDYPALRAPLSYPETNTNWLSPHIPMGKRAISVDLSAGGYVQGQSIHIQVSINNESPSPLLHFVVSLIRKTIYKNSAYSVHHKIKYETVLKQSFPNWKCESQTNEVFPVESIEVPALIPPTDTETCKVIKISYFIAIKGFRDSGDLNQREADISLDLPITIGTIPFGYGISPMIVLPQTSTNPSAPSIALTHDISPSEPVQMEPSSPAFPYDDIVSIRTYTSTPPPFPDDDFDLPTYEDALLMDEEIDINLHSIEDSLAKLQVELKN